jgi:hypothetical protein
MHKLNGGLMVLAKKDQPEIGKVLRDIDVVEKPPIVLKPQVREILFAIERVQNSNKTPTLSEIVREIMLDAAEELKKQPLVKPEGAVTTFGTKLIGVEEKAEAGKVKITVDWRELLKNLHRLVEAGYLAPQFEGEVGNEKIIFRFTPEGTDQIEKFRKIPETYAP